MQLLAQSKTCSPVLFSLAFLFFYLVFFSDIWMKQRVLVGLKTMKEWKLLLLLIMNDLRDHNLKVYLIDLRIGGSGGFHSV